MKLLNRLFITFYALALCVQLSAAESNLGVSTLQTQYVDHEISIRIFYPTLSEAKETTYGPWEINSAKNGETIEQKHPLIVISNGLGGNNWNHHLLAASLAKSGFIVAATKHPDDLLRVSHDEQYILRPSELSATIDAMLQDEEWSQLIDETRIGAFGYSLGGYTVLAAAGAHFDANRASVHCQTPEIDPNFCADAPQSLVNKLLAKFKIPKVDLDQDVYDERIKASIVAAPVGQVFVDAKRVKIPLFIVRAENDAELKFPFHAEHLHQILPIKHKYMVIEDLHHYAFLSPFPALIAGEVGEPAQDPEGFERGVFLQNINAKFVEFFNDVLQPSK